MQVLTRQILTHGLRRIAAAIVLAGLFAAQAQAALALDENKIKAGLLYNFIKYTEWPEKESGGGLRICLYGGDPFAGALSPLAGRTAQQHMIAISAVYTVAQMAPCAAVVVHSSAAASLPAITAYAREHNILTMSDIGGFATRGGMVEFSRKDERVQVLVNGAAARAGGLQISARLLKVATVVNP